MKILYNIHSFFKKGDVIEIDCRPVVQIRHFLLLQSGDEVRGLLDALYNRGWKDKNGEKMVLVRKVLKRLCLIMHQKMCLSNLNYIWLLVNLCVSYGNQNIKRQE